MAWDATRPVPWKRLLVPFAVYAGVATVVFSFIGGGSIVGIAAGLVLGGLLYVGVAVIMVKFGWNPPQFFRPNDKAATSTSTPSKSAATREGPRKPPRPTKRTNAGNRQTKRR